VVGRAGLTGAHPSPTKIRDEIHSSWTSAMESHVLLCLGSYSLGAKAKLDAIGLWPPRPAMDDPEGA